MAWLIFHQMKTKDHSLLLILLLMGAKVKTARILAVFPLSAFSHHKVIQPILRSLADAGHQLVVYSPRPLDNPPPNYIDVFLESKPSANTNLLQIVLETPPWKCMDVLLQIYYEMLHGTFKNEKIQKLLHSKEKFDLVMTEPFVAQEFTFIFGHYFKAPTIGIQTMYTTVLPNIFLGNSLSLPSMPGVCMSCSNKMTFTERFLSAFATLRAIYIYYNDYIPRVDSEMRQYFPDMPPLVELTKNISLMFINDHLTADYAMPRPPNMIPVSGIHLVESKPLSQDIKQFMDEARDGVIVFSLGTIVPDDLQPKEYFDLFINVFKKLSQRVLWKSKKKDIEGLPDNVKLVSWIPQQDVLGHPNCKLFITHGGISSQIETIHAGVPVVGIPYFGDQHRNVRFYEAQGVGIMLHPQDLSEHTLTAAIQTVLEEPEYTERMQSLSRVYQDRPMSPAKSVVYWTEYVLRYGGAAHLKPASTQLAWYQRSLLDILVTALAAFITVATLLYLALRRILLLVTGRARSKKSYKKKIN